MPCHPHLILLIFALTFFFPPTQISAAAPQSSSRPNILFVFADDLAFDCVGYSGNDEIKTPNLDRLAKRSTHFTHAYNMGSWTGAVCVASRTMLNTGHSLWRARTSQRKLKTDYVPQNRLWPQRMATAGYDTYMTGKWHVSADAATVFQTTRHVRGGMPKQVDAGYNRPVSPDDKNWLPWDRKRGGFWSGGKHWSEVVADDATDFIDIAAARDKPFFMYIAFNAAHDPRQSPREFVEMYPLDGISLPQPFFSEYPHKLGMLRIRDEKLAPFPRTPYNIKVNRQEYYAIITHLDREIGRILDHLEKSGMADNTIVMFTADHGLAVGHHGLMGKQNLHDPSVRVPLLVSGPGIPKDQKIDAPVYMQDVMPTTIELAGGDLDNGIEFTSLLPLIQGERDQSYESIYGAYLKTQRSVIQGDFKLIVYPALKERLLFDLANDPWEANDLSKDPQHAGRISELLVELANLQQGFGDGVIATKPLRSLSR